jgi:hypothetical protein
MAPRADGAEVVRTPSFVALSAHHSVFSKAAQAKQSVRSEDLGFAMGSLLDLCMFLFFQELDFTSCEINLI